MGLVPGLIHNVDVMFSPGKDLVPDPDPSVKLFPDCDTDMGFELTVVSHYSVLPLSSLSF